MSNARTSDSILGSLRSAEGKGIARVEDRLEAQVEDVWSALTETGRLAGWLGEVEGDLRLGGAFSARFVASGWEGTGRVEACEPPQRLLVVTQDADEPDETSNEVTLTADGDQTIVVVEQQGLPLDLLAAYGAGLQIHVEDLAAYLSGKERREVAKARWDELFPAYRELAAGVR